jgi:lipid II:glycine glycyltransferase (peptidoglycan interpeptide bridge formation enzyme)
LPVLNIGVAYIRWGPLWRLKGQPADPGIFRNAIRALQNEYVWKRGLVLRMQPFVFDDDDPRLAEILQQEGCSPNSRLGSDRTLLVDLSASLEELRKGMKQKWRNQLNQAEKNGLEITEGCDDSHFARFKGVYDDMLRRKKFAESSDINEFRKIQKDLPDEFKMKLFISASDRGVGAGAICSAIGEMGVYLFGATNDVGMKDRGSYLIQWKIIEWLKGIGCRWYNLHGINPEANPDTYRFKAGLCGNNGKDVRFIDKHDSKRSLAAYYPVICGDALRMHYRKIRSLF